MLTVHVQAVPERARYVQESILPSLRSPLVVDATVWVDYAHKGPLWNARRIWSAIAGDEYPGLVLQDDVILHKDLWQHVPDLTGHLERNGWCAISLYAPPRKSVADALDGGMNFVATMNFLGLPGIMLRPDFAEGLVRFTGNIPPHDRHDDVQVRAYSRAIGKPVHITVPSLVQHNPNMRSVMGHPARPGGVLRMSRAWRRDVPAGWYEGERVARDS